MLMQTDAKMVWGVEDDGIRLVPEVKAKWVAALRSGKYNQAYGQLRSRYGFCCLGVLEDVCGAKWLSRLDDRYAVNVEGEEELYYLTDATVSKVFPEDYAYGGDDGVSLPILVMDDDNLTCRVTLAYLNDNAQLTFNQIADLVDYFL